MDESFKKLNGPTADSIQSDYIAKEQRAAEELLNLQLGNAKKLADLRSKLLKKLNDEALEEGKAVEDYLADYGLQQRLKALDTEMDATRAARLGQLAEVDAIQEATNTRLLEAETKRGKLRTQQLTSETAARQAAFNAQHRSELSAIREAERLRAKLQTETLAAADSHLLEPQTPVIETSPADLEVTPRLTQELSVPESELLLKPVLAEDVLVPDAVVNVTPVLTGEVTIPDTTVGVTPIVENIESLTATAQVVPEVVGDISLPAATLEVKPVITPQEDLIPGPQNVAVVPHLAEAIVVPDAEVNVTPVVSEAHIPSATIEVTPEVQPITVEPISTEAVVTPKLATELEALHVEGLVTPQLATELEALRLEGLVTPHLAAELTVPPLSAEADVKLTVSENLPPQEAEVLLTPKYTSEPEIPPISDLAIKARVEPILDPEAALHTELTIRPTLKPAIEDLTSNLEADLALKPTVGEIAEQTGTLHLTASLPEITPPEITVQVIPEVETVEPIVTTARVTPIVEPIELEDQTAALKLAAVLETPVEDQAAVLKLTPEIGELPELEATLKLRPELPVIPEVDINAQVNPDTSGLTSLASTPVVIPTETTPVELVSEADLAQVAQQRTEGIAAAQSLEGALIESRLRAESTIAAARLTGIAAIDQRQRELLNASTPASVIQVDTTEAEADLTALHEHVAEPLIVETRLEVTRVEPLLSGGGRGDDGGDSGSSGRERPPTPPKPPKKNSIAEKLKEELEAALRAEETVKSDFLTAEETRQTESIERIVEQRKKLIGLSAIDEDVLAQRHLLAREQSEVDSLVRLEEKKLELRLLTLTTEEELAQQYEDRKANAAIDAQTRLERKRQELALLQRGATDEEAIRANAHAALEEENLNKQIKLIQHQTEVEERRAKNQLKFENEILATRLQQIFTGDDAKYAEDPSRLTTDIDAKLASTGASADIEASKASLDAEQATALAAALAAAASTGESVEAVTARVQAEFDLRRTLAEEAILATYATEDAELAELLAKREAYEEAEEKAKKTAAKKAEREEQKQHKKRLGMQAELADYGLAGKFLSSFDFKSMKEAFDEADDKEAANAQIQAQFSAAFDQMGNWVNNLASTGKASASKQAAIDTRLQGARAEDLGKNVKQKQGSYWKSISADIASGISASPFFKAETVEASFEKIVNQGIAFNVKERAFIDTLKDKIATTFDVADGTLLKLVRIQQADTTAARLGMESALTEFLNSMYATTEYMQAAAESVRQNLYEATALMGAKEATDFEYSIQKWIGSLYSVGFSATDRLAEIIGKVSAGDVGGITEGGLGNLLVMAANEASLPIADILEKGLDAGQANKLMSSMVSYLAKIYQETSGSRVLAQQFAGVYGVTAADLKAAANLSSSISTIEKNSETYDTMLRQVHDMAGSMATRTSMGEMFENVKGNFEYSMASTLANNPVLSALNLTANMLNDLVGGIEIPFINVWGFGFDLNATVADLMNVAALSGAVLGGVGKLVKGLGNLKASNMLSTFGIDQGKLDAQSRGTGPSLATISGGSSVSESGYVGNESGDDVKEKTVQDASSEPSKTVAEAKEEEEDKEEARAQALAGHIVDIYELLQDVVSGSKKFHVKLDVGNNPMSWSAGTWQ